jgi:hypothetical protein
MRENERVAQVEPSARVIEVPLEADPVAPPRLVYGSLDVISGSELDSGYDAIYFQVAESGLLGRVTFEGLDAVRAARGEVLPYRMGPGGRKRRWVFAVDGSSWLDERHDYELRRYSTPLTGTHQHFVFAFHDQFVEAIAEGIWLDIPDQARPYDRPDPHPLAELGSGIPAERFRSASGIDWELRRAPGTDSELIAGSRLCSQHVYQLNLLLDGDSRVSASIWLRTRDGRTISRLVRPWPGGELARCEGVASPDDFEDPWESYLAEVAQRRRKTRRLASQPTSCAETVGHFGHRPSPCAKGGTPRPELPTMMTRAELAATSETAGKKHDGHSPAPKDNSKNRHRRKPPPVSTAN